MSRKIVQIAVATDTTVVALCSDGTVWRLSAGEQWTQLPSIPQPAAAGFAAPSRVRQP